MGTRNSEKTKQRKIRAKKRKVILALAGILFYLSGTGHFSICAEAAQEAPDVTELSQVMVLEEAAEMKAAPDVGAETLMTYEKGALAFVTGETADGWYRVIYQDKAGYIRKGSLSAQEIDVEALDAEMAVNAQEAKFMVETVEKYRVEARRSKIWGSVIIALVVGIFAVGIISAVRTQRYENGKKGRRRREELKIQDLDLESK